MLKKHFWILLGLLTLTIALAGCSMMGYEEETEEVLEPINPADWPTPRPTNSAVPPTPFPIITMAPTATPTARPVAIATSTPATAAEVSPGSNVEAVTEQLIDIVLDELSPVAIALVTVDSITIRQGPGASFAAAGSLEKGSLAGVLGQNPGGDWLYVADTSLSWGWVPVDALRVVGVLEEAPILPPDPIAAAIARVAPSTSSDSSSGDSAGAGDSANSLTVRQPLAIDNLEPVATARVSNVTLNMRQRPGAEFKLLDTLSEADEVTVLALNRDKAWALVETSDQKQGWVSVDFLEIEGSLADAPQVLTLTPTEDHPSDQAAPIVALSGGQTGATTTTGDSSSSAAASSSPATATVAASSEPALPSHTLAPVATAIVNSKTDLRRGPAVSEGLLDSLTVDETVTVLALNENKDWALVQTLDSRVGWTTLANLTVEGALANASQVLTAWVDSNEVEVRQGPGIFYEKIGDLTINDLVSVLALNEGRSWVLVETISGGQGWTPRNFLTIAGSLNNIPEISEPLPLAESSADDQLPAPTNTTISGQLVLQTSSGGEIMLIKADGTGLRRLTNGIDPVLSPDGQTVAFTRWDSAEMGSLWTINIDGSNERLIVNNLRKAKGPDWSPDGARIVFNYQHGGQLKPKAECYDMSKGGSPRPPFNATNIRPSQKGNNFYLCWTLPPDPHWGLHLANVADGSSDDLFGGTYAFRPAWDPDRSWRIVADAGNGLLETDVNRDYAQNITDEIKDGSPAFSPDGRYLAITVGHQSGGGGYDIHRLNAGGGGRVILTKTPLWATTGPDKQPAINNVSPAWSPDGSQIAFLTDRTGRWEIWVMNAADGSNQGPMFSDEVNDQLQISYNFVDERVFSWR